MSCLDTSINVTVTYGYYYFDGTQSSNGNSPFSIGYGTFVFNNVPSAHPIAFLNNGQTSSISYTGTTNEGSKTASDGNTYTYYSGTVTVTVSGSFSTLSYECYNHGYMGGQNNLTFNASCGGTTTTVTSAPTTTTTSAPTTTTPSVTTTTTTSAPSFFGGTNSSHATRETLRISLENQSLSISDAEVLYNWKNLTSYTGTAPTTYIFNNAKTLSDTFINESSQTQPSTRANLGINFGTTSNCISNSLGYGTFSGTDVIKLSKEQELDNWTILISLESLCPSDRTKRNIIFHNVGSSTTTGFKIGINGLKNLFFEFYDSSGNLRTHTLQKVLNQKSLIAVSHNKDSKLTKMFVYNALDLTTENKTINSSVNIENGNKWYLGGLETIPSASNLDQMFSGKIYEFILLNKFASEAEVVSIFDSMICSSITEDTVTSVTETYYPPASFSTQQVATGNQILTGYTNSPVTVTDAGGNAMTFYEETPVYTAEYKSETVYVDSTTPSTRTVDQFTAGAKTYDYEYIKLFAPTCLSMNSWDGTTSYDYQIHTHTQYDSNLNKIATFNGADGSFILDENYSSSKAVYVYVNGLLLESGVGYTRDGINIKKYSGSWTESDTCIYDVIDGGATPHFVDHDPSSGNTYLVGKGGQDAYLDGKKLILNTDFQNANTNQDLRIFASTVSAGRIGVISRNSNVVLPSSAPLLGTIKKFICLSSNYLISESVWLDGVRKNSAEYKLSNSCDLSFSDTIVDEKTTVIYENQSNYYNI